ncbi:MAG: restriction endonuclease subunit S [Acidobacteriota bacterium]|nr:restriction endonuclease subunit S [Acidobacteriota bacterium]
MTWRAVRFGELLRQRRDRVTVRSGENYPNFGIYSYGRGLFTKPAIDGTTSSAPVLFKAAKGQFVYSRLFAFEGAYGLVTSDFDGCYVSGEFPLFDCDTDRVIPEFLAAYFTQPQAWRSVATSSTGVGHRRQRVQPGDLLEHRILLPSVAEQRRLLHRIDSLALTTRQVRTLRIAQQDDLRRSLLSSFDRLASTAARRPLREVAPLVRRPVAVEASANYAEVGIRSFGRGTFHKPTLSGLEVGTKHLFRISEGDLLFSNVFAWEGAIAVARREDDGRYGSHRFISRVPKDTVTSRFLCFYFLTDEGLALIHDSSPGGAGRNRTLGLDALDRIEVPAPTIEQQRAFDHLLAIAEKVRNLWTLEETELEAVSSSVLSRSFNPTM